MFRYIIAGLMVFGMADAASAGPFGIEQGMKKEQLNNLKETKQTFQFSISPPRPHSRFNKYVVRIHPQTGVCVLIAGGVTIPTSVYGNELKKEFESIREQLSSIYGRAETIDYLESGSIWDEPQDWTTGLLKKERGLQAAWDGESNANLKDGIVEILLTAVASRTETGWLQLQYRFANNKQCENLINKDSAKSF
ncbi:MAG: hypothetical protein GKS02_07875 [Alphaproteobacteria bacterium]|nr:hypothetical protein [Alphaproteobacteria bacterium]